MSDSTIALVFEVVAAILAAVVIAQTRGREVLAWALFLLCLGLVWPSFQ